MTVNSRLDHKARMYVAAVVALGAAAVLHSLYSFVQTPVSRLWYLLAGLTLLSGSFTVRIPNVPARLSVSEAFVFAAVLLFGPAAATMIVVLDVLVASFWLGSKARNLSRVLFNTAAPAVSIWISSHAFYSLSGITPLSILATPILPIVWPLVALAILYFLLNSLLIARIVAFEQRTSTLLVWRQNFMWLSLNYFSGASVAALLLPYLLQRDQQFLRVLGIFLPLLLISYLTFKTALGRVDDANRHLTQLNKLYLSTIETLAMAIDAKDQITHGHIRRVQIQAVNLAKKVGVTDPQQIQAIEAAALLHDTGKLAVPEYILSKPGPLTPAEFEKMKLHASVGADILSSIDFPYPVVPIVRHHHENWDGTGYPDGLTGPAIPVGARILSVVDCFDALTSDRPYRPRLTDRDALTILMQRRGSMYDPLIVDAFINMHSSSVLDAAILQSSITEHSVSSAPTSGVVSRLEEIAASSDEMLTLFDLAKELGEHASLSQMSDVLFKHLRRIVPSSLSVLYVYDVSADDLVATSTFGQHQELVSGLRISLGQRLSGWVGANRHSIRNSDPILDLGDTVRGTTPRLRSCLSTPVLYSGELLGVLTLYSTGTDAFTENHQRMIEIVVRQVAPVVKALLDTESDKPRHVGRSMAVNREQFILFLNSKIADSQEPTSILLVSISHVDGDGTATPWNGLESVLTSVMACLQKQMRPTDALFTYDEQTIVVVLVRTDEHISRAIANRMTEACAELAKSNANVHDVRLHISVASAFTDGMSAEDLVETARTRARTTPMNVRGSTHPSKSVH